MGSSSLTLGLATAVRARRGLHIAASHALVTLLSALLVASPIPLATRHAHAQSALVGNDSFTFSDQNESAVEHGAASDSGNALKVRTSPVGASGAYTRQFPIRVPPGRSGMTPSLALSYSSASAHQTSVVGAGWSFGVSSISRSTENGFPKVERGVRDARYSNAGLFTGPSGRMAAHTRNEGAARAISESALYAPVRESTPVRYEFSAREDRWVEHLPTGVKRYYGAVDGRMARVVNELGTHEWLLLKERDPDGNTIEYDYHFVEDVVHGQLRGNFVKDGWKTTQWQPILKGVRWGANDVSFTPHQYRLETKVSLFEGDIDMLNGHVVLAGLIDKISVFGPPATGSSGQAPYWHYLLLRAVSKDSGRLLLTTVVETAGDVQTPRTTRFSYSSNGDLYAARPGTAACTQAGQASFGPLQPLSPANPDLYRTGKPALVPGPPLLPFERLSRAHIAAGYQFRDMDADGDVDVTYMPAGVSAPVAQWRKEHSYLRDGDTWVPVTSAGVDGISSNLLITEFGDVDGDVDPDAISFPLWSVPPGEVTHITDLTREQSYHYVHDYVGVNDFTPYAGYEGVGLPALSLSDGTRFRVPVNTQVEVVPLSAPPPCAPIRVGGGPDFLSLRLSEPLPGLNFPVFDQPGLDDFPFDFDDLGIPAPDDPNEGKGVYPYLPWFVKWNLPWPFRRRAAPPFARACLGPATGLADFGGAGHGMIPILIGHNGARGASGVTLAMIDRWPNGVMKWVEPTLTPFDDSHRAEMYFRTMRDFHAPATDLNADGKADILLLKLRDQAVGADHTKTSFIPRAYISDGHNFYLDWQKARMPTLTVDLAAILALDAAEVQSLQAFRSQVLPNLAAVAPGTRVLPSEWTSPLRTSTRSAVAALLARHGAADAGDLERTSALTVSLAKLFEDDLWLRYPRPVVGLPKLFELWNDALWERAGEEPEALLGLVPMELVPNVDVDVSDLIVPLGGSMLVDVGDVLDAVKRDNVIVGGPTAGVDLTALNAFVTGALAEVLGDVIDPELASAPSEPYSTFSWSAREILREGRDLDCNGNTLLRRCETHHTYPLEVNPNSVPLDINADGLPDLVVGARPIVNQTRVPGVETAFCARGHQVHLNRGYRWDTYDEWASHTTAYEAWSSPSPQTYYMTNKLDGVIFPLEILQNHGGTCGPNQGIDHDLVDLAVIDADTDTSETIVAKMRSRMLRLLAGNTPEWDRTGAAKAAIQTSTLPMGAASFTDVNADGRVDLVFAAEVKRGARWNVHQLLFLNTGRGFRNVTGVATVGADQVNRSCVLPSDFVMAQFDATTRTTVPVADRSRLVDVDNDGLVDLLYAGACLGPPPAVTGLPAQCGTAQWRRNLRKVPDLLTTVEESTGAWTDVAYVAATSGAARGTTISRTGTLPPGHMVVSQILRGAQPNRAEWKDLLANSVERVDLSYDNYVRETGSTHALGFETVRARFSNSEACVRTGYLTTNCTWKDSVEATSVYDVRATVPGTTVAHPLRGAVTVQRTRDVDTGNESTTTTTHAVTSLADGIARIRPDLRIESTQVGTVSMYSGEQFLEPDDFGYPQRVIAGRASATQVLADHPETTVTRTEYEQRPAVWHLGRPRSTTIEGLALDVQGGTARAVLSQSSVSYDVQGRVAATSVLQDAGSECTASAAQWSTTAFPDYNTAGLPTRIEENGRVVEVRYDSAKMYVIQRWVDVPPSASSPGGRLPESLAYDMRHGTVRWHRDMNGKEAATVLDASGRVLSRTGQDGSLLERHTYSDVSDLPWTVTTERFTDPGIAVLSWTILDGYGRALVTNEMAPAAGASSAFVRSVAERIDGYGRVTGSFQPRAVARLTTLGVDASDKATLRTFDGFDRVTSETLPDGRVIRHAYSHQAFATDPYLMVQTTNPRGFVTQRIYDSRGALARVERLAQAGSSPIETFDYVRDGLGRIAQVSDASGVRNVAYDAGGRLVAATLARRAPAPQRVHAYCFDADGQLKSALTPEGREVSVERDLLGRPARVTVDFLHTVADAEALEPTVATFMYDCSSSENSRGKLCERADDTGITHYTYDEYGRQAGFELELSDVVASSLPAQMPNWFRASFEFGLAGQLKSAVYEGLGTGVHRIDYGHDVVARTTSITVDDPRAPARMLVKSAGYDEFGRVVTATLGNNVTSSWVFDKPTQHLTVSRLQQGTAVFAELRYPLASYDENGNVGVEEHWHNGQRTSDKAHTYDALDQVHTSTVRLDGVARAVDAFSFSGGNLTQAGLSNAKVAYAYEDGSNTQAVTRISSPGVERVLAYDGDGWVTRDTQVDSREADAPQVTERALTFDAGGCLREATSRIGSDGTSPLPTVTRNLCGLNGERAYRETTLPNGNVERVFYLPNGAELRPDQDLFVMRLPVATATVAHLAWSLRDGGIVPSESGYVHTDVRGSVIARTPLDAADVRTPDREAEYDAWGKTLAYEGVATPRYQFIDEEPDPGTGYYFFGARAYDPTLRRWLSPDPMMLGMLEDAAITGESLNLYSYGANNPVRFIDQSGHVPLDTIWDAGNVVWDVGKIAVGLATGDVAMATSGGKDLLVDGGAMLIPYVPAGLNKVDDVAKVLSKSDEAIDVAKGADRAADAGHAGDKVADASKAADCKSVAGKAPEKSADAGRARGGDSSSAARGREAHKEFADKVKAKTGWQSEPRLKDPKTGRTVVPDAVTRRGHPVELKPNTRSGKAAGQNQLPKYERATGKNGRVVYYDP